MKLGVRFFKLVHENKVWLQDKIKEVYLEISSEANAHNFIKLHPKHLVGDRYQAKTLVNIQSSTQRKIMIINSETIYQKKLGHMLNLRKILQTINDPLKLTAPGKT